MRSKPENRGTTSEKIVKDIRRATRKRHSAEENIRIILDGPRYPESLGHHMLADVNFGQSPIVLLEKKISRRPIEQRRLQHRESTAWNDRPDVPGSPLIQAPHTPNIFGDGQVPGFFVTFDEKFYSVSIVRSGLEGTANNETLSLASPLRKDFKKITSRT